MQLSTQNIIPHEIHWTELLGDPYRKGLFTELLTSPSKSTTKQFVGRCKGMGKSEDPIRLEVTFDEEYLIKYLEKKVIISL